MMPVPMLSPLLYCSPSTSTPTCPSPFSRGPPATAQEAVYVAAFPLRATPGPAQWLLSTAYYFGHPHLRHYLVIVKSSPKVFAFDFQPKDPENILSALAVISKTKLPGLSISQGLFFKEKSKEYPQPGVGLLDFQKETRLRLQTDSTKAGQQTWLSAQMIVGTIPMDWWNV